MKKYILYAGVNGAGKSTLYRTTHYQDIMPRVNTDEILREFGDWRNTSDLMKAGRIAVERLNSYLCEGITFNQETTLCGHTILRTIRRAKQSGYVIELHYVGVDTAEIAKKRVARRVELGGHGIPVLDWLAMMGRTKHLSKAEYASVVENIQNETDRRWERLKARAENPLL